MCKNFSELIISRVEKDKNICYTLKDSDGNLVEMYVGNTSKCWLTDDCQGI